MRPLLVLLAVAAPLPALGQAAPTAAEVRADPAFEARVRELPGMLQGTGNYADFFAPAVVAQLPQAQFAAVNAKLVEAHGPFVRVERIEPRSAWSGVVEVRYRDATISIGMAVGPAAPHQVTGLRVLGATARETSLDQVTAALDALHGSTGYAFARLGDGTPQLLRARNADQPFAVGSAFKLVILAELVRSINAGERRWDDLVTIEGNQLPGGGYTGRPKGAQVSYRELATQMISISDNSATDLLLHALGREKVEAMLAVTGVRHTARNRPFLSTLEAFKLKYLSNGEFGRRYAAFDLAGKRALLAGDLARIPLIAVDPARVAKPAMIDQIEWFFSPTDLVRIMDWLRGNTEGPAGADARAILSRNPGITPDAARKWRWVGYKGGSETGVMNMTLLLQAKDGAWYVWTGSWNDPDAPVSEGRFAALTSRAAELAAPGY